MSEKNAPWPPDSDLGKLAARIDELERKLEFFNGHAHVAMGMPSGPPVPRRW